MLILRTSHNIPAGLLLLCAAGPAFAQTVPAGRLELVEVRINNQNPGMTSRVTYPAANSYAVTLTGNFSQGTGTAVYRMDLPSPAFTSARVGPSGLELTPAASFRASLSVTGPGGASVRDEATTGLDNCTGRPAGGGTPTAEWDCQKRVLAVQTINGRRLARKTSVIAYGTYVGVDVDAYYSFEPPPATDSIRLVGPVEPEQRKVAMGSKVTFRAKVNYTLLSSSRAALALRLFDKPQDGILQASSDFVTIRARTPEAGLDHPEALEIKDFEVPKSDAKLYLQAVLIDELNPRVLARSATVEFSPSVKVFVSHLEFVQVTQTEKGEIPLIPGKRTVIRAFIKQEPAEPQITGITGTIATESQSGDPGRALVLLNKTPVSAHERPDRGNDTHSLNFVTEDYSDNVTYTLWLERPLSAGDGVLLEPAKEKPRDFSLSFTEPLQFSNDAILARDRYPVPYLFLIRVLPLCVPSPSDPSRYLCPTPPPKRLGELAQLLLPTGRALKVIDPNNRNLPFPLVPPLDQNLGPDLRKRREEEALSRFQAWLRKIWHEYDNRTDMLVALIPNGIPLHLDGRAESTFVRGGKGRVAWVRDQIATRSAEVTGWVLAHEIGHNLGLRHTNTSDGCLQFAGDPETNWSKAYPDGSGTTHEVGFDVRKGRVTGSGKFDLMTYCHPDNLWISPFHYRQLIRQFEQYSKTGNLANLDTLPVPGEVTPMKTASHTVEGPSRRADPVEHLLIGGWAARDGSAAGLDPVYRSVSARSADATDPGGSHCIEFHGTEGKLGEHCFALSFDSYEDSVQLERAWFTADVVAPAGFRRIVLVHQGRALTELTAGEKPALRIASPEAGARLESVVSLAWEASHPSATELFYRVDYSLNGGATWDPLVLDWTAPNFPLDPKELPAAGRYHFRVTAVAGLDSSSAIVGPIEVVQRPSLERPADPVAFGETNVRTPVSREVVLHNSGTGPLVIDSIESTNPSFALVDVTFPLTIASGGREPLQIDFLPQTAGRFTGMLRLASNATPAVPGIALEAIAVDPGAPRLTPPAAATLDFGEVTAGQARDLPLLLRNAGGSTLTVSSVSSSNALFRVVLPAIPVSVAAGGQISLTLRFAPTAAGPQAATLAVNSNDQLLPRWEIALRGSGIAPPAGPPQTPPVILRVDFGNVTAGQFAERNVTVMNNGTAPLTITAAVFSNPAFTGSPATPFIVVAGGQRAYTVRFAPTAAGAFTGTLTFSSTDPTLPASIVELTGAGVAAPPPAGPRTVTLQVDDGAFERILSLPTGGDAYFINRITPPSYPATLRAVQVFFGEQGLRAGDSVTILAAAHPSGVAELGAPRFLTPSHRLTAQGETTFQEFPVSPITIESGDFLVGFAVGVSADLPVMPLDITIYRSRSYLSRNGTLYDLIHTLPSGALGNFAIRAVVDLR